MYTYYRIIGKIDGITENLFGSYARADCVSELECEGDQWKDEGYTGLKIITEQTSEAPDMAVYTAAELAANDETGQASTNPLGIVSGHIYPVIVTWVLCCYNAGEKSVLNVECMSRDEAEFMALCISERLDITITIEE